MFLGDIWKAYFYFLFFIFSISLYVLGHGGEDHSNKTMRTERSTPNDKEQKKYTKINQAYLKIVKPIFKKSCFDCHGNSTVYPWYYKIPGIKQLIDSDIREAKRHLDFSKDFPFF